MNARAAQRRGCIHLRPHGSPAGRHEDAPSPSLLSVRPQRGLFRNRGNAYLGPRTDRGPIAELRCGVEAFRGPHWEVCLVCSS